MAQPATTAVLDTNVVLDWLVFRDARVAPLVRALDAGTLTALASPPMRQELVHMLASARLARWAPDAGAALAAYDRQVLLLPAGLPPAQTGPLRCSDADDQVFLDTALAHRARWLFTQDRALLKLARRAAAAGLSIVPPQRWMPAPE